jgi:MerR family copper efflux transcriptional regulator
LGHDKPSTNSKVKHKDNKMKISQLSKLTQVPNKTIRYYEEAGLIPLATRNLNGYRDYQHADIEQLIFIRRCRELQIPIEQIKILIQAKNDKKSSCEGVGTLIIEQLQKVRKTITELSLLEQTLAELAQSCPNNIVEECQILKNLQQEIN